MLESCARSSECAEMSKRTSQPLGTLTAHRGPPPDSEGNGIAETHVCPRCCYCYLATSWQHRVRSLHSPRPRCAWLGPFFWLATRKSSHARRDRVRVANGQNEGEQLQRLVRHLMWDQCGRRTPLFLLHIAWSPPAGEPCPLRTT